MDSTLQPYSYRTKRRKIVSSVSEILKELQNEENCSTQSLRSSPSAVCDSPMIHNAQVLNVVPGVNGDIYVLDDVAGQPVTRSSNVVLSSIEHGDMIIHLKIGQS